RQGLVELEGPDQRRPGLGQHLRRGNVGEEGKRRVVVRQADVGRGPIGADSACFLEQCPRLLELAAILKEASAKVGLVRPLIYLAARVETTSLGAPELGADRACDGHGDLPLQVRQLAEAALIVADEEEGAVRGVEEPHVHSYAI